MNPSSKVEAFWQDYLSTLSEEDRKNASAYLVDDFADTPEAATRVGKLVRDRIKTTTSSLLWGLEDGGEPLPKVGDISVVVDGNGNPLCIIEMVEVEIRPFNTVDEQFAFDYGEGDRTLAYWLSDTWDFHSRWCREIGREPSETMPLVFQRFRLLYPQNDMRRQPVMDTSHSIPEIVTRIERAMQRVTEAIHPLSPAQMMEPRLSDGRSVKDVLAHITWWDQWLLVTLPADESISINPITLPLADQIPPGDHWADEMNAKVYIYNQQRELSVIEAEFAAVRKHLLERVAQMSIDDLYNPDGIAAIIGQPVAPLILGIYEHYEEHADELEQIRW